MALTYDILTLAEGYLALRQGTVTANATAITALISASSQAIDKGIGPVVYRPVSETQDGEGTFLQLYQWPVLSITSVVEDGTTLASTDYKADTEKGLLYRANGNYDYPWIVGRDNVTVNYQAGRFGSTDQISEFYKEGARLLLRHLWRANQWNADGMGSADFPIPQVAFPSFAVPNAVIEWFQGEWRTKRGGFA